MERDQLVRLLDNRGEAFIACREALASGARFWVSGVDQPVSALVRTYARRDSRTRAAGVPTLGFSAAVDALRNWGEQMIRIGAVDAEDPPYHFQVFLDQALTAVMACLGVEQSRNRRRQPSDT